jgi:prepilin-type N-terminal cleavage/methylation domain-containing protein
VTVPTGRSGFTLIEIMIVISIIIIILAIATPAYRRYENFAMTRACFANQKTISSALQNYNLDTSQHRTDVPEIFTTLISAGYLQTLPLDPGGGGTGSINDYQYTTNGFGIRCTRHGILQ